MAALVRKFLADGLLPEDVSVTPAHSEYDELMTMRDRHIIVCAGRIVIDWLSRCADRHRRGEEYPIAVNDRRRMRLAWQWNLPTEVFALAPFNRRISEGSDAIGQRPAPL